MTTGTRMEQTITVEEAKVKAPRRLSTKEAAIRILHELALRKDDQTT